MIGPPRSSKVLMLKMRVVAAVVGTLVLPAWNTSTLST